MLRCASAGLAGALLLTGCLSVGTASRSAPAAALGFQTTTGGYRISFRPSTGAISIAPPGTRARLDVRELPGAKKLDLLYSVRSVKHSGANYVLMGRSSWTAFTMVVGVPVGSPGLIHLAMTVTPFKDAPTTGRFTGDVKLDGAPASNLKQVTQGPPIAGTSILMSSKALKSTAFYLSNFTALGQFFDRTSSGVSQGNFAYPRAGGKGSLVGATGSGAFGYPVTASSIDTLPRGKSTQVLDTYLYLHRGAATNEAQRATAYIQSLGSVYQVLPKPSIPAPDWRTLALKTATDLSNPANLVTVGGKQYLRSYVSDTRSAPELITQAGVLAAIKAYEARYNVSIPLDATLESGLSVFYDPQFHTIVNGLGHDPAARGESWYFVTNMISLLQAAQSGSPVARKLLLDSTDAVISLAHVNGYEFPQDFRYSDFNGKGSGLQPDVAGGYSWLMLGLFDLTKDQRYLDEAKASIAHVQGKGFDLAYETHMSAYSAAAAQRLYSMTGDNAYRNDAVLSLANLFHATRLWDCTYGNCRKGKGYHTYFGLNPLPWSDYAAILEQYEAWIGLRDYMKYAAKEPAYVTALVEGFFTYSPLTMQYTLPPLLPTGTVLPAAGEYPFVPHNNLAWYIPVEDLRVGEQNSGIIGQEIYGAGGPFIFAAYAP